MDETTIPDERLSLVFTCCHPALAPEAQVALTLRLVGGLTTAEIARAFLVSRRRSRSGSCARSAKIRDGRHPLPRAAGPSFCRTGSRRRSPSCT